MNKIAGSHCVHPYSAIDKITNKHERTSQPPASRFRSARHDLTRGHPLFKSKQKTQNEIPLSKRFRYLFVGQKTLLWLCLTLEGIVVVNAFLPYFLPDCVEDGMQIDKTFVFILEVF